MLRLKEVRSGLDDGGVSELGRCCLNMAMEERWEGRMNRDEIRSASRMKGEGESLEAYVREIERDRERAGSRM